MRSTYYIIILVFVWIHSVAWAEEADLHIGIMLCLTGNCADWGNAALKGAQIAADELNDKGGILSRKIVFDVEDTAESISGANAVTSFRKLASSSQIKFIIGPSWSPGARAVSPLIKDRNDIVVITPSASAKEFTAFGDNIFNMRAPEEDATVALAHYAISQGWKRAAIFSSQQPAEMTQGRIFDAEFRKLGGSVSILLETLPTATDLRTETSKILSTKPDFVFLMNYNQMNIASQELTKQGFSGGRLIISIDENRIAAAKGSLEGAVVARSPGATFEFSDIFKNKFGHPPGLSAEGGYDAIKALALSIEKAASFDISQIKKNMSELSFYGASGEVKFNSERMMMQKPVLLKVVGKKLIPIGDS